MKTEIHPAYKTIKVVCSCGNAFETRSTTTKDEIHTDVCSSCHPFYTGKQKIMDTAGRVEKFKSDIISDAPVVEYMSRIAAQVPMPESRFASNRRQT